MLFHFKNKTIPVELFVYRFDFAEIIEFRVNPRPSMENLRLFSTPTADLKGLSHQFREG